MQIHEKSVEHGSWLFRWRSYVPVVVAPVLILGVSDYQLLGGNPTLDGIWSVFCILVSAVGLGVRAHAIGHAAPRTSGGNVRHQVADDLNTSGLYSVVRHPLYLGNALLWLGITLFSHQILVVLTIVLFFWVYYERIMMAEEAFLLDKFGDRFRDWAAVTPAFIPKPGLWRPAARAFNLRRVVGRDYAGAFAAIAIFTLMEAGAVYAMSGRVGLSLAWWVFFGVGLFGYVALRFVRLKTGLLDSD